MTLLIVVLSIIAYSIVAMGVKAYYKIYKCSSYMPEDAYIVGIFWPIYAIYRLLAWPLGSGSRFIESRIVLAQQAQEKVKEKIRIRSIYKDRDLEEAEREVEALLIPEKERSSL